MGVFSVPPDLVDGHVVFRDFIFICWCQEVIFEDKFFRGNYFRMKSMPDRILISQMFRPSSE